MERGLILVADEDHRTYNLLSQLLDPSRYELLQSARGSNVVDVARVKRPRVIFLAATTAHLDDICDALKHDQALSQIPLVLLDEGPAIRHGGDGASRADYFLAKPLKLQTLAPALAQLMPMSLDGPPPTPGAVELVELDEADIELSTEPAGEAAAGQVAAPTNGGAADRAVDLRDVGDDALGAAQGMGAGGAGAPTGGDEPNAITAFLKELDRSQSLYKQKIERLQAELAEARREVRRLTEERQRAFDAAEAAHIEKEAVMERLGEEIVEREQTGRTLEQLLRGAIMERSILEADVKSVLDRISGLRDELKQAQEDAAARIDAVRDEYQKILEQQIEATGEETEDLEARMEAAEQAAEETRQQVAELQAALELARAGQSATVGAEDALQRELEQVRAALEVVIAERDAAQADLADAGAALEGARSDSARLHDEEERARSLEVEGAERAEAARTLEEQVAAQVAELEERISALTVERNSLEGAAQEAQGKAEELRARTELLEATEAALGEALTAAEQAEDEARRARAERDAASGALRTLEERAQRAEQLHVEARAELDATSARAGAAEKALEERTAALESAQGELSRRQQQLTQALARAQEVGADQTALAQQVAGLEELVATAMAEAERIQAEAAGHAAEVEARGRTIEQLEARQRELIEGVSAAEELRQALEATTQEVEALRQELGDTEHRVATQAVALEAVRRELQAAEAGSAEARRATDTLRSAAAEAEALRAATDEALDQTREELGRATERAEALEAQGRLLEDELRRRGAELEASAEQAATTEAASRALVEEVRRAADEANRKAEALDQALAEARADHEVRVTAAAEALDEARAQHEARLAEALDEARAQHEAQLAEALDEARAQHEARLAAAMDEARAQHEAQLASVETGYKEQIAKGRVAVSDREAALEAARGALQALREEHDAALVEAREATYSVEEARAEAEAARVDDLRARTSADEQALATITSLREANADLEQQISLLEEELQGLRDDERELEIQDSVAEPTVTEPLAAALSLSAIDELRASVDDLTRDRTSLSAQLGAMRSALDESRGRAKELEAALREVSRVQAPAPPPPPGTVDTALVERLRKELRGASESIRMCLLELEQSRDRLEHGRREINQGREGLASLFADWQKLETLLRDMAQDPAVRPALARLASVLKDVRNHIRDTRGILEHSELMVRAQDELTTSLYRALTRSAS